MIISTKLLIAKLVIYIASFWVGRPDISDDLFSICNRETSCNTDIKEHLVDAYLSGPEWVGQVRLGHLNKKCQKKRRSGGWATHGLLGLSAGAHHKFVPPCYKPEDFDNPIINALIGARKYIRECWMLNKRRGWCSVNRNVKINNVPSPKMKVLPKVKKPNNWIEFIFKNPW